MLTLETPGIYLRIFDPIVDLISQPITYQEKLFCQLLFLHMTTTYVFLKSGCMMPIEKLELDFYEILLAPIPRAVWTENRKYYNSDFQRFLGNANKARGIRRLMARMQKQVNVDCTKLWTVLVISPLPKDVVEIISQMGDTVIFLTDNKDVNRRYIEQNQIDYVVSFGSSRSLKREVFSSVPCISAHAGSLAYNKRTTSHFWILPDNTPICACIHYIDEESGSGDIIARKEIVLAERLTTRALFETVVNECRLLFANEWPKIRSGTANRTKRKEEVVRYNSRPQKGLNALFTASDPNIPIDLLCGTARLLLKENVDG
jgi:hypothetical protein